MQSSRERANRHVHFLGAALSAILVLGCYQSRTREGLDASTRDDAQDVGDDSGAGEDASDSEVDAELDSAPSCPPPLGPRVSITTGCRPGRHTLESVSTSGDQATFRFDDCEVRVAARERELLDLILEAAPPTPIAGTVFVTDEAFAFETYRPSRCGGCDSPPIPWFYFNANERDARPFDLNWRFGAWDVQPSCGIGRDGCEGRGTTIEAGSARFRDGANPLDDTDRVPLAGSLFVLSDTARCVSDVAVAAVFAPRVIPGAPCRTRDVSECAADVACSVAGSESAAPLCDIDEDTVPWGTCTARGYLACPCPDGFRCVRIEEANFDDIWTPCEECDLACCDDLCRSMRTAYCERD